MRLISCDLKLDDRQVEFLVTDKHGDEILLTKLQYDFLN